MELKVKGKFVTSSKVKIFENPSCPKETLEESWQMTMESLIILHLLVSSDWSMHYIEDD